MPAQGLGACEIKVDACDEEKENVLDYNKLRREHRQAAGYGRPNNEAGKGVRLSHRGPILPDVNACELMMLFRGQHLDANGNAYFKSSMLHRPRKQYAELRGSTLVIFRNEHIVNSPALILRDIVAVLVIKLYKVTVEKKQGKSPRFYICGPGLDIGQSLYIKASTAQQLELWRQALATATSVRLPSLMSMTVDSIIGQGGGGKVFLVNDKSAGATYALKVIDKKHTFGSVSSFRHVVSERSLMEIIGYHPFVLQMKFAFQSDYNLFIGTPFCRGGDLATYLKNQYKKRGSSSPEAAYEELAGGPGSDQIQLLQARKYGGHLSEDKTRIVAAELILVLEHLHTRGIVYRDLKPENVLIDCQGHLKLGDFGLAKHLQRSRTGDGFVRTSSICGTRNYLPPEMLSGKLYSFEADMWSFGVMLFRMLCGRFPFDAPKTKEVFLKVKRERLHLPPHLSNEAKSLLEGLLCRDQEKRLTVEGAKGHIFFKDIDWNTVLLKQHMPPIEDLDLEANQWDILENFDLSKLQGISLGEYVPEESDQGQIEENAQCRIDPEGRIIGFEYVVIDEETPTAPPLEVKRVSGFMHAIKKNSSGDSENGQVIRKRSTEMGEYLRHALSPRASL